MVAKSDTADLLEAMEKGRYEIQSVEEVGAVTIESLAICE